MLKAYRCGDVTLATADASVEPKDTSHWSSSHPAVHHVALDVPHKSMAISWKHQAQTKLHPDCTPTQGPEFPKFPGLPDRSQGGTCPALDPVQAGRSS